MTPEEKQFNLVVLDAIKLIAENANGSITFDKKPIIEQKGFLQKKVNKTIITIEINHE